MTTKNMSDTNHQPRKTLAWQIDRLDHILDGLAEALNEAVAQAVQEAVTTAAREALQAVVSDLLIYLQTLAKIQDGLNESESPAPGQPAFHLHECLISISVSD